MHLFDGAQTLALFDGVAAAALACAATCRARNLGANPAGALILGCLCGLVAAMLREVILNGAPGSRLAITALPDDAALGALAAILAGFMLKNRGGQLFLWLDGLGMGLAGSLCAILSLPELGLTGSLALGALCGLMPGILRDMALGDTAMAIDKEWYAIAAVLGVMAALAFAALAVLTGWISQRLGEIAVILGALVTLALRIWKGREF